MPHFLITGQTMSGKSTLAKRICRDFLKAGRRVLVLDPMADDEFRECSTWTTDSPTDFLRVASINTKCALVIDEGGQMIGRYNVEMERLATQFRHLGHNCFFLSQRPMQLPLTMRINTVGAFVFSVGASDADGLAKEYVCDEIRQATGFRAGQYIFKQRFAAPQFGRVF